MQVSAALQPILHFIPEVRDWEEQQAWFPYAWVLNNNPRTETPRAGGIITGSYRSNGALARSDADIEKFLLKITGKPDIADVLMAFLAAIVTRQSDAASPRVIGGGTGKSTFMALLPGVTGSPIILYRNPLKHLENNSLRTAKFWQNLGYFDSNLRRGEVSVLKQMTGQTPSATSAKGVQQCLTSSSKVILSANGARGADLTSSDQSGAS